MTLDGWLYGVLLGIDQLAGAVAGLKPDETISSRAGRGRRRRGLWRMLDRFLGDFQKDHGVRSIEYTPWGTVDPHHLSAIDQEIAQDWVYFLQLMGASEEQRDHLPPHVHEAAERSAALLRHWVAGGGRDRWLSRMRQDHSMGEQLWRASPSHIP